MELYLYIRNREIVARRSHYLAILEQVGEERRLAMLQDIESGKFHRPGKPSFHDIAVERTQSTFMSALQGLESGVYRDDPLQSFAVAALPLIRPLAVLYGSLGLLVVLLSSILRRSIEEENGKT